MPRLQALNKYWSDHPPTHILVAAYMGVKPKSEDTASGIEDAAQYMPVAAVSSGEMDDIMRSHGLPVGE